MINLISNILIGKLFRFYPYGRLNIIIACRINHYWNLEILIARVREDRYSKSIIKGCNSSNSIASNNLTAEMLSWYCVNLKELCFENRQSRSDIRNCLRTNPDKVKYKLL